MSTQEQFWIYYPDLQEQGGLSSALQSALDSIGSPFRVKTYPDLSGRTYASVESGRRFSQVYIAAQERLFIFDFWKEGVLLAQGGTTSIEDMARAQTAWLADTPTVGELCRKFDFVTADKRAEVFEQGREVEWAWQQCGDYIPREFPELMPYLELASGNETLRSLFPFTSHNRFCLSRCTGFPYSYDCPVVSPIRHGYYEVLDADEKPIGRGDAVEALDLVLKNLPANCGTAVKGTARELSAEREGGQG